MCIIIACQDKRKAFGIHFRYVIMKIEEGLCYFLIFFFCIWFITVISIEIKPEACYVRCSIPILFLRLSFKGCGLKRGTKHFVCLCACFLSFLDNELVLVLWVKHIYISKGKAVNMLCLNITNSLKVENLSPLSSISPLLFSKVMCFFLLWFQTWRNFRKPLIEKNV